MSGTLNWLLCLSPVWELVELVAWLWYCWCSDLVESVLTWFLDYLVAQSAWTFTCLRACWFGSLIVMLLVLSPVWRVDLVAWVLRVWDIQLIGMLVTCLRAWWYGWLIITRLVCSISWCVTHPFESLLTCLLNYSYVEHVWYTQLIVTSLTCLSAYWIGCLIVMLLVHWPGRELVALVPWLVSCIIRLYTHLF